MIESELYFEDSPWDRYLDGLRTGEAANGAVLLALSESEEERTLEDVLTELEERRIPLDISQVSGHGATGEAAVRLKREQKLSAEGMRPELLPEDDPLRLYLEEVAAIAPVENVEELAWKSAGGDEEARDLLTKACLRQVVDIAAEHVGRGVLLLDLIQEGSLGLWQAVCDWQSGEFARQSEAQIRFAMAKAVLLQAQSNGLGQKLRTAMEDYRAVDERLLSELGRTPSLEEIAEELHMTAEAAAVVRKNLENAGMMARVKQATQPEEDEIAQTQAVEDTAYFQMRQRIGELLSGLEETDRQLLTLRYGLENKPPMTPEAVGERLGLTPQEVLNREAAALAKLRTV